MRLSIAGIFARCPGCAGDNFEPVIKISSETRNVFVCAACRMPAHYNDLMRQIGREAVKRAKPGSTSARANAL
jgi:hypothetical protein